MTVNVTDGERRARSVQTNTITTNEDTAYTSSPPADFGFTDVRQPANTLQAVTDHHATRRWQSHPQRDGGHRLGQSVTACRPHRRPAGRYTPAAQRQWQRLRQLRLQGADDGGTALIRQTPNTHDGQRHRR
jgi:hypothetical protein